MAPRPRRGPRSRMEAALAVAQLVIGVDRLDYSKGIPERLRAFEILLRDHQQQRGRVTFCRSRRHP